VRQTPAVLVLLLLAPLLTAQQSDAKAALTLNSSSSTADVRVIADAIISGLDSSADVAEDAARAARILLMARDYERAADLFESAYLESGGADLTSLFYQAVSLVELGDPAQARRRAQIVVEQTTDYELKRRAYALVARTLHLQGRSAEALPMLETLAELNEPALVEPETLLLLSDVEAAEETDAPHGAELLQTLHPDSIAAMSLTNDRFRRALLPSYIADSTGLLGPAAVPAAAMPEGRPAEVPAVTSVQVGSFSDRENAEHLAEDLVEIGLPAGVSTAERDGRELSLVIVDVQGGDPAAVAQVLAALEEAGYEGFLIY
jgi:tetratricopeptide (TPR) repeat protein